MAHTTYLAYAIMSQNNNLSAAMGEARKRFESGTLSEGELLRVYDALVVIASERRVFA